MATKRKRGNAWNYIVKNKRLLPKPQSFTFDDEAEGDKYIARLEQLLAAGIVPPELKEESGAIVTVKDAIREYRKFVSVAQADKPLLDLLTTEMGTTKVSTRQTRL